MGHGGLELEFLGYGHRGEQRKVAYLDLDSPCF